MNSIISDFRFLISDLWNFHLRQGYGGQAGGVGLFCRAGMVNDLPAAARRFSTIRALQSICGRRPANRHAKRGCRLRQQRNEVQWQSTISNHQLFPEQSHGTL